MHHNPDLSPNQVVGDESGIIKLSIFVGCYFRTCICKSQVYKIKNPFWFAVLRGV